MSSKASTAENSPVPTTEYPKDLLLYGRKIIRKFVELKLVSNYYQRNKWEKLEEKQR